MIKITQKQQQLLLIFIKNGLLSSSKAHGLLLKSGENLSLVTVKLKKYSPYNTSLRRAIMP